MAEDAKSSPDLPPAVRALLEHHTDYSIRVCSRCGIKKILEGYFYRDRSCRGGYRPECKKCRNRARAAWARARYVASKRGRYRQV